MEDDYMSDSFLEQICDVRPGLVRGVGKRKLEVHKRNEECKRIAKEEAKSKKLDAKNKLIKGLETNVISEDNPGFKMMQKMGFKQGIGLGKEGEGRVEPIKINPFTVKSAGLGQAAAKEEECKKIIRQEQQRLDAYKRNETELLKQFRESKSQQAGLKHLLSTVRKCQNVCRQMDEKCGIVPPETWYWPPKPPQDDQEEDEEEEEDEPDPERIILPQLDAYLRYQHSYCVWCGVKYVSREDLITHCPGDTQEAHDHHDNGDFADDTDFAD
ncbi:hypothetical protein ACHWQZ_G003286 [Mnemiopsis leidyi]